MFEISVFLWRKSLWSYPTNRQHKKADMGQRLSDWLTGRRIVNSWCDGQTCSITDSEKLVWLTGQRLTYRQRVNNWWDGENNRLTGSDKLVCLKGQRLTYRRIMNNWRDRKLYRLNGGQRLWIKDFIRTRQILWYRATATLWRLQIKQYTGPNEGGGGKTSSNVSISWL